MVKSKTLLALALPLALFSMAAQAKLYKWVDQNGETHYGQTIPPEYANQHQVQIKEGMEVKDQPKPKVDKQPAAPKKKTRQQIQQERYDNMLLATYANEGEIDDQRDRSLQLISARINSIQMQLKAAQKDLNHYRKTKASPRTIGQAKRRVNGFNAQLASAQADANRVRARYAADKKRYRELTAPHH